jgi:C-terminal processing protease CtpA/Prc
MVDRSAEFLSMFDQVWNRTNKTFYSGDFHGADWNLLRSEYLKHLPHVGNNYEFSELLAEMLGELNISHSGSTYGGPTAPTNDATAQLGIFYDYKHSGAGMRIVEVIKGGPLDKAGLNVKPGTLIEKIDGVTIEGNMDMDVLLNRKADKNVLLSLDEAGKKRDIVVKPITLGTQNNLLYRRWVDRNREEVERESGGKLGYVHIPGMNDGAFRTTFEEIMGRYPDHEAMVVDIRFNGGGDLVADLEMFLTGKRFFEYTNHRVSVGFEPNFRWTKPSISLVNESAYSDGHCYAYMYQTMKIGKMVGQPVPGTCTFGGWGTVGDGIRWGVPGVGVRGVEGEYLENRPTFPEIEVFNRFEDLSKGIDEQLRTAIKEMKK